MPTKYEVQQGETLPEIARRHGFLDWRVIRDHPDNEELFRTRTEDVLHPGDAVWIPDREPTTVSAATGRRHEYVVPTATRYLRVRLLDGANVPLADYPYELHLRHRIVITGHTDADGIIHTDLPDQTSWARLELRTPDEPPGPDGPRLPAGQHWSRYLRIGRLDPPTERSGLHARLQNLGYYGGDLDAEVGQSTRLAILRFEIDWLDPETDGEMVDAHRDEMAGGIEDRTLERLVEVHDNLSRSGLSLSDEVASPLPEGPASGRITEHVVAPVAEESNATFNTIRLHPPPDLVLDAHMHIQSNNCAPMPLVWGRVPGLLVEQPRRNINWLGSSWAGQAATGQFGVVGQQRTDQVGDTAEQRNRQTFTDETSFPRSNQDEERLTPMIVLPMDMELAHFDGYFGEPIYYPVARRKEQKTIRYMSTGHGHAVPIVEWIPMAPAIPRVIDPATRAAYPQAAKQAAEDERDAHLRHREAEVRERSFAEAHGIDGYFYYYLEYSMDEWQEANESRAWTAKFVDEEEFDLYEDFGRQQQLTLRTVVRHPWRYLPLFHYEPRRWQLSPGAPRRTDWTEVWDEPFDEIATPERAGPYIGFKMYTPLGYKPSDYEHWLPRMASYFGRCESEGIPILAHCTPGGMYTNERHLYYESETEAVKASLRAEYGREPRSSERVKYYSDAFVSPSAWRPVMRRFPNLTLCLAHFVGDDWEEWTSHIRANVAVRTIWGTRDPGPWWEDQTHAPWLRAMVQLIEDYDRVYTDVSYFFVYKHEAAFAWLLRQHPKLKRRINFGTDWYMVENSISGYDKYCRKMKASIDRIGAEVFPNDPIPLWQRFTRDNPLRCYRLKEIATSFADGLRDHNQEIAREAPMSGLPWNAEEVESSIDIGLDRLLRVDHLDPT